MHTQAQTPIMPLFLPCVLFCLSMPKGEASLSEQQDAPQETALAISLSYIYKVSLPAVPTHSPDLFSKWVL